VAPGVLLADLAPVESDARTVPWSTIRRLALEAGRFPPLTRPVTEGELADLLTVARDGALDRTAEAFRSTYEFARLQWWLGRYAHGGGGVSLKGCECKENPYQLRITGRAIMGFSDLGDVVAQESGLAWAPGWNTTFEPILDWAAGPWWVSVSGRLHGRFARAGVAFDDPGHPLNWPDWPTPTGKDQVREARMSDGGWKVDAPRAMAGVQLGNWALNAGWAPRRTGPGDSGALALDMNTRSFPAFTARRTRPFVWGSGLWRYLSPANLLVSSGPLSDRLIRFHDGDGNQEKTATPWFFQWLVGWQVEWFRFAVVHTAIAAPREGTLWPDLLQINFPVKGTTWDELDSGAVTDRILATHLEIRWRHAPWPILPRAAGRLYWDYGGTDSLPSGPGGYIPQISVPASVIGVEFLGPKWDLGFEYAELTHENVLWYSNSGFPGTGFSHEGWVLGHPLGGSGERIGGLCRWRPEGRGVESTLRFGRSEWGTAGQTPGNGRRLTVGLTVGRDPGTPERALASRKPVLLWEITAEWNRERADQGAFESVSGSGTFAERNWWRLYTKLTL